ncbi:type II toxin-antitoxin system HicB family antitoxin [Anaerovorax odorimutans]|uniref:hypothetical protein n=1 Tax=Anaerovorax odorimutans TaxID=109327 RepID=UPI0004233D47|nr:hypothetical protein [Anaerovorax odorimutans]
MEMAQEALGLYIVSKLEHDEDIPNASAIDTITPKDGFIAYVTTDIDKYKGW